MDLLKNNVIRFLIKKFKQGDCITKQTEFYYYKFEFVSKMSIKIKNACIIINKT